MCAGSVASDTSTLQSPAGSRPQGGVLVSSELAQRVEVVVRQAVRHRSVGSNLPVMFEASACRRESRAVRYSNTPLGVAARALTQDDTCHPDRSQSNVVAFIGCRILRILLGSQSGQVACCLSSVTMLPAQSQGCAIGVSTVVWTLSGGRGVSTESVAVQLTTPSGVVRSFGNVCWAHSQIHVWFAAVPLS